MDLQDFWMWRKCLWLTNCVTYENISLDNCALHLALQNTGDLINLLVDVAVKGYISPCIYISFPVIIYLNCKFPWTVTQCLIALGSTFPCRSSVFKCVRAVVWGCYQKGITILNHRKKNYIQTMCRVWFWTTKGIEVKNRSICNSLAWEKILYYMRVDSVISSWPIWAIVLVCENDKERHLQKQFNIAV